MTYLYSHLTPRSCEGRPDGPPKRSMSMSMIYDDKSMRLSEHVRLQTTTAKQDLSASYKLYALLKGPLS